MKRYFILYDEFGNWGSEEEPDFSNLFSAIIYFIKLIQCEKITFAALYKNKPTKYCNVKKLFSVEFPKREQM